MADYSMPDELQLTDPAQYRALFEPTRQQIVSLLLERAATTSELAETLGRPKGTIGHHLQVLAEAGLVHVVRTKKVRALEAKYYGRTARVFWYDRVHEAVGHETRIISDALTELRRMPEDAVMSANRRYARIPAERADEWAHRMNDLLVEFGSQPAAGEVTYALVFALFPTDRSPLRPKEADE
jgi:DNA-binding transcriptional ArsR family regulator